MTNPTPLAILIELRMSKLGLDNRALGFRLGYSNPAKAAGAVAALCDGHILSPKRKRALRRLPMAIDVPVEVVDRAVEETNEFFAELKRQADEKRRLAYQEEWAAWSARFIPHAVLLGERTVPSQITILGIAGGSERFLIIKLDASEPPDTFVNKVKEVLPSRLFWPPDAAPQVPFFGKALGYVINYSPDHAVRYDLDGEAIETLGRAAGPGHVSISLGNGKPISRNAFARALDT